MFHSEADFQFAFARAVDTLDPEVQIRLELPLREVEGLKGSQYLDLMCFRPGARTAIELKYFTRRWTGTDGITDEEFRLRYHAATDLARRNFVFDLARLEQFCRAGLAENGLAIMLTNEPNLWSPSRRRCSNDREFHMPEGTTLTGTLQWAKGMYPGNTRTLSGTYRVQWRDYSILDGTYGTFRWLALEVA
ncbi:hypothetical protein LY71_12448 [Geodermatophilus tzadiensis]|uniref:Uncharacterized protein n=1 Tax=Geodermatophilus tzadiensis TaxID=1137988 RepID=A0A2T0SUZ2_9ACTN|nr:hypothetical protein LY71_12448 [Geodermatophilus tzadiensis]